MNRNARRRAQAQSRTTGKSNTNSAAAADFRAAVEYLRAGDWHRSAIAHRRVLELSPRHPPSLHHLGLIAYQLSAPDQAIDYIRQSVDADPSYHEAWLNLAVILGELRRSNDAIAACKRSLALQPKNSEAYAVLGNLLKNAENSAEATEAYLTALRLKPDQPVVLIRLSALMLQAGNVEAAMTYCRRALAADPANAEAKKLERRILAMTGSIEDAESSLAADSTSAADLASALNDLGTTLRVAFRHEEAIEVYGRASFADPSSPEPLFNMALAFEALGRREEALASYQAGLAIDPNRADAYTNVGNLLRSMNLHDGAIQALEHAISLDPASATAHYNLAVTLKVRSRYDESRAAFAKSVELAPNSVGNRFELINLRRTLCDWDGLDADERASLSLFRAGSAAIAPFQLIAGAASRADQLEAARRYSKLFAVPDAVRFSDYSNTLGAGGRPLRIGWLSSDFFEHATAMLLVEVLESLDRTRFENIAYCYSNEDGSALRRRTLAAFDKHVPIHGLTDRSAARAIHGDGVDILIDLKGYTRDARTEILAYRPAPLQVNYLGYPATMGADFIDYILADETVAPMAHQDGYSERIVHLPNCYQPNDRRREIAETPMTRADFGLPDGAFVFCSFNNSYKLNPTMFDIWMTLLKSVPGSVLWLLVPTDSCHENLRREASRRGVDPSRLVFAKRLPTAEHLARHRLADLFLDVVPCNAHTTTSDALWAGLPVLTITGETFSGRVAGSLLRVMGLPELVTANLKDYSAMALALAQNPEMLTGIRERLSAARETAPLYDTARYTRNLESAFETMANLMRAGEPPKPFTVSEQAD
ncbi:hypothetical protein DLM45_01850 [Hyphomicrobium methylovorum]|uniref:tetratricopeptide repeat protein n=1 Tax=Hyphomicrobium methylovorum TaxID=84 RepID=UPI0015E63AAE|nr:tetratricopeptide repeat protein [Hyphomicrobium methylovorum]MBA2124970.1 hypothetical protein [Hyphomicrobium methylovorum]